jgi:uncharacterized protein (TIGR00369 family)
MSAPEGFRHDVADTVLALPIVAAFGMRLEELDQGRAVSRLAWRPEHSHRPGSFQANPMAALADFTGVAAALTLFPAGTAAATADYTVKFLAEARGDELVARARVLRSGSLTVSAVDVLIVTGAEELLCATALVSARLFRSPAAG